MHKLAKYLFIQIPCNLLFSVFVSLKLCKPVLHSDLFLLLTFGREKSVAMIKPGQENQSVDCSLLLLLCHKITAITLHFTWTNPVLFLSTSLSPVPD